MSRLSDKKLNDLRSLPEMGGFWYITKQNLKFRDLCFMAKLIESWNDRNDESYESFFNSHKSLVEFGSLSQDAAHRGTKNCEYIGLLKTPLNGKYSAKNLTPFYFALKKLCKGDFDKLYKYSHIIDKQLERMYIDYSSTNQYSVQFQISPIMFLLKILIMIGDATKKYSISTSEFKLFVATAQQWNDYFEVVESILRYRSDNTYKVQCDENKRKVADVRYNVLSQNHSQLMVTESLIEIKEDEIKAVRRKVAEYELSEKVHSVNDMYSSDIVINLPHQLIYFGAPGTGKSHTIKAVTSEQPEQNVFRTTFHPDSDYSTFVGCYKPTKVRRAVRDMSGKIALDNDKNEIYEETITYEFVPQAFTKAYIRAWQTNNPVFLVIEEINRGNCAQIFGDLFQLLDRENGVSEYPIKPDNDLGTFIAEAFEKDCRDDITPLVKSGSELQLPHNLYIWATMNTSDQSLFPIDSAFKRRWEWRYIPITNNSENYEIVIDDNHHYDWWEFISKINEQIFEATRSEDKKLGYFFVKKQNKEINISDFVYKVIFYLWNDVFKDNESTHDAFLNENREQLTFLQFFNTEKANTSTQESEEDIFNKDVVIKFIEKLGVANKENKENKTTETEE